MNFALSIFAAAGLFLLATPALQTSRRSLVARMRLSEAQPSSFSVMLKVWGKSLRSSLVSRKKQRLALAELPEVLELMSVSLNAGESLFGTIARVGSRARGVLPDALKRMIASLELGSELDHELKWLANTLPQRQIIEFSTKLSSSLRRGTPLAQMLTSLAESTRAELRNEQLKQAGRNETRMLIPLVFLILPVTVLFAIYPSIQLINTGNI